MKSVRLDKLFFSGDSEELSWGCCSEKAISVLGEPYDIGGRTRKYKSPAVLRYGSAIGDFQVFLYQRTDTVIGVGCYYIPDSDLGCSVGLQWEDQVVSELDHLRDVAAVLERKCGKTQDMDSHTRHMIGVSSQAWFTDGRDAKLTIFMI